MQASVNKPSAIADLINLGRLALIGLYLPEINSTLPVTSYG